MSKIKNYKVKGRINEKEYDQIHQLSDMGLTVTQISDLTKWSQGAISLWLKYPDWKSYCEYKATLTQPKEEKPLQVTTQTKTYGNSQNSDLVKAIYLVADEIRQLRMAWEATPNSKNLFQKLIK